MESILKCLLIFSISHSNYCYLKHLPFFDIIPARLAPAGKSKENKAVTHHEAKSIFQVDFPYATISFEEFLYIPFTSTRAQVSNKDTAATHLKGDAKKENSTIYQINTLKIGWLRSLLHLRNLG